MTSRVEQWRFRLTEWIISTNESVFWWFSVDPLAVIFGPVADQEQRTICLATGGDILGTVVVVVVGGGEAQKQTVRQDKMGTS